MKHLSHLTALHLHRTYVGDTGAHFLSEGPPSVTTLDLSDSGIGDSGVQSIVKGLPNLKALDLAGNEIGDAGVQAISKWLPQLAFLDLGLGYLQGSRVETRLHLSGLSHGDDLLHSTQVQNDDVKRVTDFGASCLATRLLNLKRLDLGGNRVGSDGVRAIVENTRGLEVLTLEDNETGDLGVDQAVRIKIWT